MGYDVINFHVEHSGKKIDIGSAGSSVTQVRLMHWGIFSTKIIDFDKSLSMESQRKHFKMGENKSAIEDTCFWDDLY